MNEKIHLRIVTPLTVKTDEYADMVIMSCVGGDMGVMPGHITCSAILDYGVLRIVRGEAERRIAVFGGVAEINENVLTVLTAEAEWPEDIDRTRAELERDHLERRIQEGKDDIEIQRDQGLLRRSLVMIEVSADQLIPKRDWTAPD